MTNTKESWIRLYSSGGVELTNYMPVKRGEEGRAVAHFKDAKGVHAIELTSRTPLGESTDAGGTRHEVNRVARVTHIFDGRHWYVTDEHQLQAGCPYLMSEDERRAAVLKGIERPEPDRFEDNRSAEWRDKLDENGKPTCGPARAIDWGCDYCGGPLDACLGVGKYECPWCIARFPEPSEGTD